MAVRFVTGAAGGSRRRGPDASQTGCVLGVEERGADPRVCFVDRDGMGDRVAGGEATALRYGATPDRPYGCTGRPAPPTAVSPSVQCIWTGWKDQDAHLLHECRGRQGRGSAVLHPTPGAKRRVGPPAQTPPVSAWIAPQ